MEATLKIPCKRPELVKKSLEVDIEEKGKIKVSISADKKDVIIKINTQKISYLKAVINSYLSLINSLNKLEEIE